MLVRVDSLEFGTTIYHTYYGEAVVVGSTSASWVQFGWKLIAWKRDCEKPDSGGCFLIEGRNDSYHYINNISDFHTGTWLRSSELVRVLEYAINIPNQLCVGCNKSAPHKKPNFEDKYMCLSCIVEKSLC